MSQFEKGAARPSRDTLVEIARALNFPTEFFTRSTGTGVGEELDGYFRSLRSTSASDRRRARARAQLLCYFVRTLERYVQFPDLDLPRYEVSTTADRPAVEAVADAVRRDWRLQPGPVDHVVRTLERQGIITARFPVESERVDAFSVPFVDRPVIVLGADKADRGRSRFDAAHELGHLVMHTANDRGSRVIENQAHWFAAALLMPEKDIKRQLPASADWSRLLTLKQTWSVSLAALLLRAKNLGVMSETNYIQSKKTMSARGWRLNEPGYLGPPERPVLLSRAVTTIEDKVSLADLASDADLPLDEIESFLGAISDSRPAVDI